MHIKPEGLASLSLRDLVLFQPLHVLPRCPLRLSVLVCIVERNVTLKDILEMKWEYLYQLQCEHDTHSIECLLQALPRAADSWALPRGSAQHQQRALPSPTEPSP